MLSWSWVGGFVQAEGWINVPVVGKQKVLFEVSQNDENILVAIREFFGAEFPGLLFPRVRSRKLGSNHYFIRVHGSGHLCVLRRFAPYLRGEKLRRALLWLGDIKTLPIDADWVTGFWEGDGWVQAQLGGVLIGIGQKDEAVLVEVRNFFGWGSLARKKNGLYSLQLQRGYTKDSRQLHVRFLLDRVNTGFRRKQLEVALEGYLRFVDKNEVDS